MFRLTNKESIFKVAYCYLEGLENWRSQFVSSKYEKNKITLYSIMFYRTRTSNVELDLNKVNNTRQNDRTAQLHNCM